ncbi:MAG: hypothetical protein DA328_08105 [Nitrososphaeraceae archaeon]|nr:hypothetical protein [Nitrososphaeraceae archaeon]
MEMIKVNTFSIFGILFLSSVLLASGMYSNNAYVLAQQENEAEVEADIEQENKCKKDTECENENELNNQLDITTITEEQQTSEEQETTLTVIKNLVCLYDSQETECPINLTVDDFQIIVDGNNPSPSEFPGSTEGTVVTIGAGPFTVSELNGPSSDVSFEGDCERLGEPVLAEGIIEEGQHLTCTITNTVITNS